MDKTYLNINRTLWDHKTPVHLDSEFYDHKSFLEGRSSLNEIELALLPELKGKKVLHLQCHFGQDTLSLARMGAEVTGVDLSPKAIEVAQKTARDLELDAKFVCGDVFEIDQLLDEQYDFVFTSYGVIGWLPELNTWGKVIEKVMKPNAQLLLVEFHPVIWMFDEQFEKVTYGYFDCGAIIEETEGTYTDRDAELKDKSYSWNHSLEDVFQGLSKAGLEITNLREYDYSPYDCFNNTVKSEKGYQIKGVEGKLPMVYALEARKKS
ncbi:class I SAM-dependent methyltransferase [Sediminitomix flava]|uniref:Methyltransferase family protein n=1 Tax=Sediminitomix flava TaxID=379075 RepID=A0A315ZFV5_SEDFL|nr:class I SAM-dependent methyltransferase [Sediminitomix flava]PWJ44465.1 methyltransferase family protein [Sediminitomix flava]